ncbi:MAG: Gfo/Idh/MocA family oxidoreductase [Oscillospiraceae bacterium]|jgi:predicted dehydrogenase|nr:Gfo/Idh/MocA family oxidoreductase [Oscillospiraceae bacterium]
MAKIKTGIIGCGGIANQKHLPALANFKDRVEIVAFCDIVPERAEKTAEKYGAAGAKTYTDYRQLLEDKSIDDVHICTPNVSHCEITIAALEAGKHVLCEKPMAATASDAEKMMAAYKKSGKLFSIGYQNRYRTDALTLKKLCEEDVLGEIYFAKAQAIRRRGVPTWGVFPDKSKQGGGPLIDIGTHALDITLWMMDNYKPKSVMGASFEKLGRLLEPGNQGNSMGTWDNKTFEVEDSAFGFVTMENGAVIIVESSWALNSLQVGEARTLLCGTKAGADMLPDDESGASYGYNSLRINTVMADKQTVIRPEVRTMPGVDFFSGALNQAQDLEAKFWLDAIEGKGELLVKPEQALVVTQILDAIYKSSATGQLVTF